MREGGGEGESGRVREGEGEGERGRGREWEVLLLSSIQWLYIQWLLVDTDTERWSSMSC